MYRYPCLASHLSYISYMHLRMLPLIERAPSLTMLPFLALLIFLFSSAILASKRLGLDGGCCLRGAPLTGLLGTLIDSSFCSVSAIWLDNLSASLFINLILFLLNLECADRDVWDIFSLSPSICNFRLLISEFRWLVKHLGNLVCLAFLHLHCCLVRGSCSDTAGICC